MMTKFRAAFVVIFKNILSVENVLTIAAVGLAILVFYQAGSEHAERVFHGGVPRMWNSPEHAAEVLLFLSPCIIFAITTIAYYRFIIRYTGEIAGWSVVGLFAALYCCVKLLEAEPDNWGAHLKWVYFLFLSYVVWDVVMLMWFLARADNQDRATKDKDGIRTLSFNINLPTLFAVFCMWIVARHLVAEGVDFTSIGNYVSGVVAFHLVFASGVCLLGMLLDSLPRVLATLTEIVGIMTKELPPEPSEQPAQKKPDRGPTEIPSPEKIAG